MVDILQGALLLMRFVLFGLTLALTLVSFQAYAGRKTDRLKYAFVGFAFISMGVAAASITTQIAVRGATDRNLVYLQFVETVPFIVGFAMLYLSLYR